MELKWFRGYVVCRAAGGSYERFLNICRHHNIEMQHIRRDPGLTFSMNMADYPKLVPLSHKTSVVPHIVRRVGFPFLMRHMMRQWTFYTGFLLFLVSLEIMSSFVWQITFTGQKTFTKETLSKDMDALYVHTGMRRKNLDCDAIEKSIREFHPQISWVSAEEVGSLLKISIKEGQNYEVKEEEPPHHLTAAYDGTVKSVTVSRGTAMVKPGDKVKKGDVLISGIVPVTDDSDTVVDKIAVAAGGEVVVLAEEDFSEDISLIHEKKEKTGRVLTRWTIQWGDYRFSIKNPFKRLDNSSKYDIITDVCCDKNIYPFSVPVKAQKKVMTEYRTEKAMYSEQELKEEGNRRYHRLLFQLTQDEMELLEHSAVLKQRDEKNWFLQGRVSFLCRKTQDKAVTQEEMQVEKPEGGQNDDASGNNS